MRWLRLPEPTRSAEKSGLTPPESLVFGYAQSVANLRLVRTSNAQVIDPQSLGEVDVLDFQIRAAAQSFRQASMRIAYYGFRLRHSLLNDWSPVGAKDEEDYRKKLGLAQSTWYKLLNIGSALYMVKLADMERIPVGNAELLMKVEPTLWLDYPWVEEAQTLSPDDFAARIVQRNRRAGSDQEPMVNYRVRVPYSAKRFMEETVERFRQEQGLSTPGEALEYLIADLHDRPNVMAAIERANRYIRWAMYRCRKRKMPSEMQWLERAWHLLNKAYSAVRMDDEEVIREEDEKEVYPAQSSEEFQDYNKWIRDMPFLSRRQDGKEAPDNDGVSDSDGDVRLVPDGDDSGDGDDSFEG